MSTRSNVSASLASSISMRAFAAHAILITYTLIALFPVAVILINSFKTRKAIFRSPLSLPNSETFSLVGYETVMKQGDFVLYFQNSLIVTVVSLTMVLLFGAMAAFCSGGISFPSEFANWTLSGTGDHDPDPAWHGSDLADDGRQRTGEHTDRAHSRLYGSGIATGDLYFIGIHAGNIR